MLVVLGINLNVGKGCILHKLCHLVLKVKPSLLHLIRWAVNLDGAVILEDNVHLGQVLRDALDACPLLANDILVQPGGAGQHQVDHAVCLLIHLGQGQAQLLLGSAQRDRLALVGIGRHLNKDPGLSEDLVDGVATGADHISVLRLLHLNLHH